MKMKTEPPLVFGGHRRRRLGRYLFWAVGRFRACEAGVARMYLLYVGFATALRYSCLRKRDTWRRRQPRWTSNLGPSR